MDQSEITSELIASISETLKRLARADPTTRKVLQAYGVDVIPVNFYSNLPSIEEIENSYEYAGSEPPYLDTRVFEPEVLTETLRLLTKFSAEFDPPQQADEENATRFFWNNPQFGFSDAMAYYCFIRLFEPKNVVEIGGGFSTLVAMQAMARHDSGRIHCIEPYPRPFLVSGDRVNLQVRRAQDVSSDDLNDMLGDGDILFIDSTHTVKTGSDCLHIYLRLLPKIRRNIIVHVHDVFLPFGMPKEWLLIHQIYWTEQYLLQAFLLDNQKTKVLYGSNWNAHSNRPLMQALMEGKADVGGGSLWFTYNGAMA